MWEAVAAVFLIAHGPVHIVLVAPHPDVSDARPGGFLTRSWLVMNVGLREKTALWLGIALMVVVTFGFVVSGVGVLVEQEWWRPLCAAAAGLSLLLISLFWHRWLVAAPLLDVGILVVLL